MKLSFVDTLYYILSLSVPCIIFYHYQYNSVLIFVSDIIMADTSTDTPVYVKRKKNGPFYVLKKLKPKTE